MPSLTLLPFTRADGPTQMALDEWLLERGQPALRFYAWDPPTQSLGYFQPFAERLPNIATVRRSSGGGAIIHHHDLTYSLTVPRGAPWRGLDPWPCRMHYLIRDTLAELGVDCRAVACGEEKKLGPFLCFQHQTPGDLVIDDNKIVGSAQRQRGAAILQHGSLLLARSPFARELPGIAELTGINIDAEAFAGRLAARFATATGWAVVPSDWPAGRDEAVERIAATKYANDAWTAKR